MKIGIFDSGLGGLFVLRSLQKSLPQYDYVYLGDTKRVPYGGRSQEAIYTFTRQAVEYLFRRGCTLVILACNTSSARALRRIQHEYLPKEYPKRRVLGVIIPTVEAALENKTNTVAVLATQSTVDSKTYIREFRKRSRPVVVFQQSAPLLVPLVENNGLQFANHVIRYYLRQLPTQTFDTLILGCTHYGLLKAKIQKQLSPKTRIISQDVILPKKLKQYLQRHPTLVPSKKLNGHVTLFVTDITSHTRQTVWKWFGSHIPLKLATLSD